MDRRSVPTPSRVIDAPGTEPGSTLAVVMQAADSLISSTEPAVVFDDLVQRSAPLVCEAARAMVYGPGATLHASTWPQDEAHQPEQAGERGHRDQGAGVG